MKTALSQTQIVAGAVNPAMEQSQMKINTSGIANGFGGAMAITFLACGILSYIAPGPATTLLKAMVHVADLTPITKTPQPFELGPFVLGWIVMSALAWVFGWLLGAIYNATNRNPVRG